MVHLLIAGSRTELMIVVNKFISHLLFAAIATMFVRIQFVEKPWLKRIM